MSTSQESMLKMDNNIPLAFQWVMTPSTPTIGEMYRKRNMCRSDHWILLVCAPPLFIVSTAGGAGILYNNLSHLDGFPWCVLVYMMAGVYLALVFLVKEHMTLFLPEAPFAAWEAVDDVGYNRIGIVVAFASGSAVFFVDHPWVIITWACLLGALIAGVIAFWVCLIRMYRNKVSHATGLDADVLFPSPSKANSFV